MTTRVKIFFFGGIILLFVIGLILTLVNRRSNIPTNTIANESINVPVNESLPSGQTIINAVPEKKVTTEDIKVATGETVVKNLTKNFVERFGSYSLESNFSNFDEIEDLVTPTVASWLKTYPQDLRKKLPAGFTGVTTLALSQKVESLTDTEASLSVSTQREETVNGATRVYYQDMKVNLVFTNGQWLVDGAYWQ